MNFTGLAVGAVAFCCIGIFHPIVVKAEYYGGRKCRWAFFAVGMLLAVLSLEIKQQTLSILTGTAAFSILWAGREISEQHKRVLLGHAKRNPNREYPSLMLVFLPLSLEGLQFSGLITGFATYLFMAIGHYSVIRAEYHFTKKCWIAYLIVGIAAITCSLLYTNIIISVIFSIFGFISLWGIQEVIEQEERVKKGWFPKKETHL